MNLLRPLIIIAFAFFPIVSLAQNSMPLTPGTKQHQLTPEESAEAAKAAGATCAVCGTTFITFIGVMVALNIALLVWVARDAKNRGMDNPVMWLLLVFFTHFIGLIVYLFSRTKGNLAVCSNCRGKRLTFATKCPHCHCS